MECQEITKAPVAMEIMQTPEDNRLPVLFHCIYCLFYSSFLNWIFNKFSSNNRFKDKLWEDAKDAFQNGLVILYYKVQKKELIIKGSLKATVYTFGLLQLLAFFKKERFAYGISNHLNCFDLFFEDDFLENERQEILNERDKEVREAISKLPQKQRAILCMKFFNKLPSRQIAEKLGVSTGNVDNESVKAYKALRTVLIAKFSF